MNNRETLALAVRDLDSFHYLSTGDGSLAEIEFEALSDGAPVDEESWRLYTIGCDTGHVIEGQLGRLVQEVVKELALSAGLPAPRWLDDYGCTAGLDYDGSRIRFTLRHEECRLDIDVNVSIGRFVESGVIHAFFDLLSDAVTEHGTGTEAVISFIVKRGTVKTDAVFMRGDHMFYMSEGEENICHRLVVWELARRECPMKDTTGVLRIANGIKRFVYVDHSTGDSDEFVDRL